MVIFVSLYEFFVREMVRATVHGLAQSMVAAATGGDPLSAFASASLSSLIGHGAEELGMNGSKLDMLLTGGLTGGLGSVIMGGNFWDGVGSGLIVTGLNMLKHNVQTFLSKKAALKYMWNNSFDSGKDPDYENFAWEVEDGRIIVLPNDQNTSTSSRIDRLPLEKRNGEWHVKYGGKWLKIVGAIHTHPHMNVVEGTIGVSPRDVEIINFYKLPQNQVIFNNTLYDIWDVGENGFAPAKK